MSAADVAKNAGYDSGYVRDTLKELASQELVDSEGNGGPYYRINDSGECVLASGEITGEDEATDT